MVSIQKKSGKNILCALADTRQQTLHGEDVSQTERPQRRLAIESLSSGGVQEKGGWCSSHGREDSSGENLVDEAEDLIVKHQ